MLAQGLPTAPLRTPAGDRSARGSLCDITRRQPAAKRDRKRSNQLFATENYVSARPAGFPKKSSGSKPAGSLGRPAGNPIVRGPAVLPPAVGGRGDFSGPKGPRTSLGAAETVHRVARTSPGRRHPDLDTRPRTLDMDEASSEGEDPPPTPARRLSTGPSRTRGRSASQDRRTSTGTVGSVLTLSLIHI